MIELMLVMGVMAIFLALGIAGYRLVQKQGRDTRRENITAEIAEAINSYRLIHLALPDAAQVQFSVDGFYIDGVKEVDFNGYLEPGSESDSTETKYHYDTSSGGFLLCTLLESESITEGGTLPCPDVLP